MAVQCVVKVYSEAIFQVMLELVKIETILNFLFFVLQKLLGLRNVGDWPVAGKNPL